jgi:hypothetical protein
MLHWLESTVRDVVVCVASCLITAELQCECQDWVRSVQAHPKSQQLEDHAGSMCATLVSQARSWLSPIHLITLAIAAGTLALVVVSSSLL